VQQSRLYKENQPLEQLDKVIEEIKKMILKSTQESVSRETLNKGELARATAAAKNKSERTTPREGLGSRWISTLEKRSA
jgi:hypothetical protein